VKIGPNKRRSPDEQPAHFQVDKNLKRNDNVSPPADVLYSDERPSLLFTPCGESMHRRLVCLSTVALAFIAVFAVPAPAQRVLGVGDDALVLPRGVFRFRTLGQWTQFNERYGRTLQDGPTGLSSRWD